jgi:3-hydroxyacyl-[acyl-carrier-protein] dehydratase
MPMTLDFEEVRGLLKQRFPFLMVDRVLELDPGKRIRALKNVTGNEIQFLGHFPKLAIMPAALLIEGLGQTAVILLSKTVERVDDKDELLVLGMIDQMRFLAPVFPGDTVIMEVAPVKMSPDAAIVATTAKVNETVVATGKLGFVSKQFK